MMALFGFGFAPGPMELLIIGLMCSLMGIPAIVLAVLLISRRRTERAASEYGRVACPVCGESIAAEAVKCRFCGERFGPDELHRSKA